MPYTQRKVRASVTCHGPGLRTHDLGIADKWDGADGDSDTATYDRATGSVNLGGKPTRDDGIATYLCDEVFWPIWLDLDRYRGEYKVRVSVTPTGDDGTPFTGGPAVFVGTLKKVPSPKGDFSSNEANAVALEMSLDAERA